MWKHFLIWLMVLIFLPLAIPSILTPKKISAIILKDYNAAITILGEKDNINHRLITIYNKNLSIVAVFANEFRDKHDDSNKFRNSGDHIGKAIADIPSDWSASVKLQAYSMALRIVVLSKWGIWLLIPMIMGLVAGFFERKLKSETFRPPIPPIYNTAIHMMLALTSISILWLICPIPIPLSIIPIIVVLMSFLISLLVAHHPHY